MNVLVPTCALWLGLMGAPSLVVTITPRVGVSPCDIRVTAVVERNALNRSLDVEVDGPNYYRETLVQLDGEDAPRTTWLEYRALPSGDYLVRATVRRADRTTLHAQTTLEVE